MEYKLQEKNYEAQRRSLQMKLLEEIHTKDYAVNYQPKRHHKYTAIHKGYIKDEFSQHKIQFLKTELMKVRQERERQVEEINKKMRVQRNLWQAKLAQERAKRMNRPKFANIVLGALNRKKSLKPNGKEVGATDKLKDFVHFIIKAKRDQKQASRRSVSYKRSPNSMKSDKSNPKQAPLRK